MTMSLEVAVAALTLLAVLLIMGGETALAAFNERLLRGRGAVASADDVLRPMLIAYPTAFVAMAIEGALFGPAPPTIMAAGLALLGMSKALKMWAISTLGVRWTYRILVVPGAAPVTSGPYAFLRHPNYLAVLGEMTGVALIVDAPVTGPLAVLGYGFLLRRKIAAEDRALGRQ
jgi:methyltransferase